VFALQQTSDQVYMTADLSRLAALARADAATYEDAANELDQLFRQPHTQRDVIAIIRGAVKSLAAQNAAMREQLEAAEAVVVAARERVRLRKAVRANFIGAGPLPNHNEIFDADDALDAALAALAALTARAATA
jgi:hypothetical protein